MNIIETFPRPGGIFWGKITRDLLKPLACWSDVVLNDSQLNGPENEVVNPVESIRHAYSMKAGGADGVVFADGKYWPGVPGLFVPKRFWSSVNCLGVFVDAHGKPSVYWPQQCRLWTAAEAFGAWLVNQNTGLPIEAGAPRVRFFDLTNRPFARVFAAELAATARQVDGLFLDEAHSTLGFMRSLGPFRPSDEEWTEALRYILRQYATMMRGAPKPVVTNGTFGRQESSVVSGRFWQAVTMADIEKVLDDAEGAQFTMVHSCAGLLTPDQLRVLAGAVPSGEACWQFTQHNGAFDAANVFPGTVGVTA